MKNADLFEYTLSKDVQNQPFADAVRPTTLDEIFGQDGVLGEGKLLRDAIARDRLPNLILWGPPGTGKTTLARVIALQTHCAFEPFSAVLGGVKEIRSIVEQARTRRLHERVQTILFIDEIHRFNKSQQDALLPHVEDGTVTLIGATTENPSFELNAALLSRSRVVVLKSLTAAALCSILRRAFEHPVRQVRWPNALIDDDAISYIAQTANGDARRSLVALEVALERSQHVTIEVAAEALNQKVLLYDKNGDGHYEVISAFIKSMRGSDPHAAAYWLHRMLEAGEDPLFILRRMVIFASEDIGLADPRALQVATAAVDAFRFVGLPEGLLTLTEAATYLACAPKSNTVLTTMAAARKLVESHGNLPVPLRLRNATTSLQREMGFGRGYRYPHEYQGHYVHESYLPDALIGQVLFNPLGQGEELYLRQCMEAAQMQGVPRPGQNAQVTVDERLPGAPTRDAVHRDLGMGAQNNASKNKKSGPMNQ